HEDQRKHGWIYKLSERGFDLVHKGYERSLSRVLRHQFLTLVVMLSTVAITVYLYIAIPKGFFPQQDTGRLSGAIQADQSTSFQAMSRLLGQFAEAVGQDPAVDNVIAFCGGGRGTMNSATMFVALKPVGHRTDVQHPKSD